MSETSSEALPHRGSIGCATPAEVSVSDVHGTNRPEQLEPALASRPGRIDQAIEFPLPDDDGRAKLVRLYSRGLDVPAAVLDLIVRRSQGSSPAFIKELMRRSAQFLIEMGGGSELSAAAVDSAIEEMVFIGGALNLKLLGGEAAVVGK